MPQPVNSSIGLHANCRCLRSKEMFYEVEGGHDPIRESGSGIYWCIHTMNCLGPDGKVAEHRSCKPGRECYDAV